MGQLGAASSLVQALASTLCLRRGLLPPVAGLLDPAPGPLRPLTRPEPATHMRAALCVSTAAPGLIGAVRVEIP